MDERQILFLRHGQTDWNAEWRYQGHIDVHLNDAGQLQAQRVAKRLCRWVPEGCFVSPLQRAKRTAEIVAGLWDNGPTISIDDELREMSFGIWEGRSVSQIMDEFGDDYLIWRDDPSAWTPPKGEPFVQVVQRSRRVLSRILSMQGSRFLVVTHGGFIRAAIVSLFSLSPAAVWRFRLNNCALVGVSFWKNRPSLLFFNDCLHDLVFGDEISLPLML